MGNLWAKIPFDIIPSSTKINEEFWDYFKKNDSILEVGCGKGRLAYACVKRGLKVTGIDINRKAIELLNKDTYLFGTKIYYANILNVRFKEKFKGVLLQGLLSALVKKDRIKCLNKVKLAMDNGGYLHISEFEISDKFEKKYQENFKITGEYGTVVIRDKNNGKELCRTHNFYKKEIIELIEKAGFKIINFKRSVFISYHGGKKPGMMIIAKKI